ncbi:hypothetical protein B0H66DRAFT_14268 [Apodospora peruviana]|uniref:Uncharacterized protein n=1 Tax=Apodospora peruviana TaxID=516989 RepID=A0AAE0IPW4_9PEZI|nr:hypothetical protein B0H66DRAFT_14268 [Apodospora peruviana]
MAHVVLAHRRGLAGPEIAGWFGYVVVVEPGTDRFEGKRDEDSGNLIPAVRPVFGVHLHGQDFHFTLARGAGRERDQDRRWWYPCSIRLWERRCRWNDGSVGIRKRATKPWFTKGGIEFDISGLPLAGKGEDKDLGPKNMELWETMFDQLNCHINTEWDGDSSLWSSGMYFQIYGRKLKGTTISDKMAPMGPEGQPSGVPFMEA